MIRLCPSCNAKNRVPTSHLTDTGRCGACRAPLPPVAEPLDVDATTFREIVAGATVPVLVDFWAAWCGPCKMAAPEVQATAKSMSGRALVLKVDTERYPELASEFGVRGIPNFVVLNRGALVGQHAGLVDRRQMQRWLEDAGRAA
jgi:thioredoxin 2